MAYIIFVQDHIKYSLVHGLSNSLIIQAIIIFRYHMDLPVCKCLVSCGSILYGPYHMVQFKWFMSYGQSQTNKSQAKDIGSNCIEEKYFMATCISLHAFQDQNILTVPLNSVALQTRNLSRKMIGLTLKQQFLIRCTDGSVTFINQFFTR